MDRRDLIDMVSGIAGGVLLILAVVLFAVVPQDDPVPPTFRATYIEQVETVPLGSTQSFEEQQTVLFPIHIESQYVHRISFTVRWSDDIESSDPDTFGFQINSPDGERVTDQALIVSNPPANRTDANTYVAESITVVVEKAIQAPPRSGPTPGLHPEEDEANARARLLEELVTFPAGEWSLEVYLDQAGDCPTPQRDPKRSVSCETETQGNDDDGNTLEVVSMSYTTYDIQVEEIVFE